MLSLWQKTLVWKKTGSLTNVKVYNSRLKIVVVADLKNLGNPVYRSEFLKKSQFEMNINNKQIKCPFLNDAFMSQMAGINHG